jgi:pSer/pThr/pTyr-binding forkhead associated (FHA) protein
MRIIVEHVTGAKAGQSQTFENPQVIRFGRHPSNEVQFDAYKDLDASSRHAELRIAGDKLTLVDVGSSNGTLVGADRVTERALVGGEEVQFGSGGPKIRIVIEGSQPAPPPTVASSQPLPAPPQGVRTTVFRAAVENAVQQATRPLRTLVIVLAGVAVLATVGLLAYRARSDGRDEQVRKQMVQLMEQQRSAGEAEKVDLQKKLDQMSAQLGRGSTISQKAQGGIYLVALHLPWNQEQGFCTAFAIEPDVLVTNSHCVAVAEEWQRKGARTFVVRNGHPDQRFDVAHVKKHPAWKSTLKEITPDVGLLSIEGKVPEVLAMADDAELRRLSPGDIIYLYGFPGRLADVKSPAATFVNGVIGRMTRLSGEAAPFEHAQLVQHSAFTSGGTSGSPIFDGEGHVIAVNAGGYVESGTMKVMDPASGRAGEITVAKNLAGYNFGMRIDLVRQLLELVK